MPRDRSWEDDDEGWSRGDGYDGSHDHDWSGSHEDGSSCDKGSHEGYHGINYEKKMIATGVFIGIIALIVFVVVLLCCCKKKNRRNMSVANLRTTVIVPPATAPKKTPLQYGGPMPEKDPKALEALSVPALATTPAPKLDMFGVPPPEYRSTVDLREQPANPREEIKIASPPPNYEA